MRLYNQSKKIRVFITALLTMVIMITCTIGQVQDVRAACGSHDAALSKVLPPSDGTPVVRASKKVPLRRIIMNRKQAKMTVGNSIKLKVTFKPSNTSYKNVKWKSSNPKVASVKNGKVTAKKPGKATITATAAGKKASCKITVKPVTGKYLDVSQGYSILNRFRTTKSNQWYWNQSNTGKVRTYGLKKLRRDALLEKIAKARAKEQWEQFYVRGNATHDRLDGSSCQTAYPDEARFFAECLAFRQNSVSQVITDGYVGFAETDLDYDGQAHRRIILSDEPTRMGFACYIKEGKTSRALCLGY